jgi:hypothetical protein
VPQSIPRLPAAAFYACVLALLVPIWYFPYFPSADGPSHLFNAYVFLNYAHTPIFQSAYSLHIPTAGNLTGHALAIFLLKVGVPPEACEKLIATLCLVGLALAFHYAVSAYKPVRSCALFLILPLLYNWPWMMGFWSFSLGMPFLLVCVGLLLRYQGRWSTRTVLLLFLVAGAAYLCHPIAWAVCGLVSGIMAVAMELPALLRPFDRRRAIAQALLPVAAFLPFAIPNLIFAQQNSLVIWEHFYSLPTYLWPLYTNLPLHLFDEDSRPVRALFLVLLFGSVLHLGDKLYARRFETADILLPAAFILLAMGLLSPARIGEGTFIAVRLLLFGLFLWVLWFGLTLPRRALPAVAVLAVVFTGWLTISRLPAWRTANRALTKFVELGRVVPPNAFVCQLEFIQQGETVWPLEHAVDLLSARNIVDVRDYEAGRFAFWTRFRDGYFLDESYLDVASQHDFEGALGRFEKRTGKHVDWLFLVQMKVPPEQTLQSVLPTRWNEYHLVRADGKSLALYQRQ